MARSTWVDLDLTLSKKTNGDINEFEGIAAVKSSLTNIFETLQGRRRMRPRFASTIYELLFEPLDEITAAEIGESLLEGVERWDNRVEVVNVNVYPNHDQNRYDVRMTFRLKNSSQIEDITTILLRK